MEYLKIKYREREYLLEDLISESNQLLKELVLPKEFNVNSSVVEFGFINDIGYAIAGEKFRDLNSILSSARFTLYNSHLKIHKQDISWESGYYTQFWLRGEYLKNSIVWYNSCEDYIMQIIWFAFEFYSDVSNYEVEMGRCRYSNIINILNKHTSNQNVNILLQRICDFHKSKDVFRIRKLANLIKHNQVVRIKDLNENRHVEVNLESFSTRDIEKECIDIDDTILSLVNVHKEIIKFGLFLFEFISFDNMFVFNDKGEIKLGDKKEKNEYKKISIKDTCV